MLRPYLFGRNQLGWIHPTFAFRSGNNRLIIFAQNLQPPVFLFPAQGRVALEKRSVRFLYSTLTSSIWSHTWKDKKREEGHSIISNYRK